jgi:2-oxoglutarate dehydrogenase E2 component (dihydrolipoamide succinyltransferase)
MERNKNTFERERREKLTYTPIGRVAKALKDFPGMNISVDGLHIKSKKYQPEIASPEI